MARFDLSAEEWVVIAPLLPPKGRGPARKDDRVVLNGIFYILRTGAPWRDLPERYRPHPLCGLPIKSGQHRLSDLKRLQLDT